MESVYCDDISGLEIFMGDKYPSEEAPQKHTCSCGKAVCCGKHKGCAAQKEKIRFIKDGRDCR